MSTVKHYIKGSATLAFPDAVYGVTLAMSTVKHYIKGSATLALPDAV